MWNYLGKRYDLIALECSVCKKSTTLADSKYIVRDYPFEAPFECPSCHSSSNEINWDFLKDEADRLQNKNSLSFFGGNKFQDSVDALMDKHIDIIDAKIEQDMTVLMEKFNIPEEAIKVHLKSPVAGIGYIWIDSEFLKIAHSFNIDAIELDKSSIIQSINISDIFYFVLENKNEQLSEKTALYYGDPLKILELSGDDFDKLDEILPKKNFNTISMTGDKNNIQRFTKLEIQNAKSLNKILVELGNSPTLWDLTKLFRNKKCTLNEFNQLRILILKN